MYEKIDQISFKNDLLHLFNATNFKYIGYIQFGKLTTAFSYHAYVCQ